MTDDTDSTGAAAGCALLAALLVLAAIGVWAAPYLWAALMMLD